MNQTISNERINQLNNCKINSDGKYVLYCMISARRLKWNFGLKFAVEKAKQLNKPLVVIEPLNIDHKWASDRIHNFVINGMLDNRADFENTPITYFPFVETTKNQGKGILRKFSELSTMVVIDDFPTYFPKIVVDRIAPKLPVKTVAIDSNGLLPMKLVGKECSTAHSFRRFTHKNILPFIEDEVFTSSLPSMNGLRQLSQFEINDIIMKTEYKMTPLEWLWRASQPDDIGINALSSIDIDHEVFPVKSIRGGSKNAYERMKIFLDTKLEKYSEDRNKPSLKATSGMSPWLHFGHISTHEIVHNILKKEKWDPGLVNESRIGSRSGWWGMSESAEGFLDQLITWRELGFNFAYFRDDHTNWTSLPQWAQNSLEEHSNDYKEETYSFEELESAQTSDPVWNAAQNQLVREGIIQNYLRMLWGKKILQWSPDAKTAMDWMIKLNDRWALDGRDPNSYTGIFWVLGRHDRAWFERPIFGKIRYMTSNSTKKKYNLDEYLKIYG
ncbi:MAG: deoxyribodipyrimidine photolyase [Methanobacteriota archaeon]|nr:MAG: deoxyribodipyrimidine photolyase [Euryarchaeota archaeon]|tara:strand:- start:8966 stop:10465 length:1500 start_codon:yes stop_codon:yes gene_type:complete